MVAKTLLYFDTGRSAEDAEALFGSQHVGLHIEPEKDFPWPLQLRGQSLLPLLEVEESFRDAQWARA